MASEDYDAPSHDDGINVVNKPTANAFYHLTMPYAFGTGHLTKHVQIAAAKELARESGDDHVYVTAMHQTHTALVIPPHDRMEWTSRGQFVKATPAQPLFSHIAISARRTVWYGQCLLLFHFKDSAGVAHERAFVRYYDEDDEVCPATGCKRLSPTLGRDAFSVIELDSILSLAHIVRSCTDPRFFLVNRFIF
ncbi:unnamed protein product [Closterium sp. Yama58-4]|nr:unnamed protein product [Closterium sp. Yama58-4]